MQTTVSENDNRTSVPVIGSGNWNHTETVTGIIRDARDGIGALPSDGQYLSATGRLVRITRRPAPDSTAGSVEIAMRYGRGGAAKEFYCLEHHAGASARAAEVLSLFLDDISPYGESYARTTAQEQAFAKIRPRTNARSKG